MQKCSPSNNLNLCLSEINNSIGNNDKTRTTMTKQKNKSSNFILPRWFALIPSLLLSLLNCSSFQNVLACAWLTFTTTMFIGPKSRDNSPWCFMSLSLAFVQTWNYGLRASGSMAKPEDQCPHVLLIGHGHPVEQVCLCSDLAERVSHPGLSRWI